MKEVTEYVKVGELCEAPDGAILKCVKNDPMVSISCDGCHFDGKAIDCHKSKCFPPERADNAFVHFELVKS